MNASSGSGLWPTRIRRFGSQEASLGFGSGDGKEDEMSISFSAERELAASAARAGGKLLLEWRGRFSVRRKGVNDVVTEADHAAQDAIQQLIERRFPNDDFLGEESDARPRRSQRRWIVDPLDGTTNYVHGFPFFCTSVAFEADGKFVAGAVYDPVRNECFSAALGAGADCNGAPLLVSTVDDLDDALICAGFPADVRTNREPVESFVRFSERSYAVRRLGSAALGVAYVAAGRFDVFWSHRVSPWDVGASAVIVREAGGLVSHFDGRPYAAEAYDLLATNGLLHAKTAELIVG
jgi:myo-inositol-1(or 4)-monophosphatase